MQLHSNFPTLEHAQILHRYYPHDHWDQWQPGQLLPGDLEPEDWLILYKIVTAPEKPRAQLKSQRTSTLSGIERELKATKQRLWNLRYRLKHQHDPTKKADYRIQITELCIHIANILEPQYAQFKRDAIKAYNDHFDITTPPIPSSLTADEIPFDGTDSID